MSYIEIKRSHPNVFDITFHSPPIIGSFTFYDYADNAIKKIKSVGNYYDWGTDICFVCKDEMVELYHDDADSVTRSKISLPKNILFEILRYTEKMIKDNDDQSPKLVYDEKTCKLICG